MSRILFWLLAGAVLCSCTTLQKQSGILYSLRFDGPTSATEGNDVLTLYDAATELCPGALRATYTMRHTVRANPAKAGKVIEGCYVIIGEDVLVAFEDGDQGTIPLQDFIDGRVNPRKPVTAI